MEIEILRPIGFCSGVCNAINKAIQIKNDYPNKRVFILGDLVHNSHVISHLSSLGIINIVNNYDEISKLSCDDIAIFTAHGHDAKIEKLLDEKGIKYYDCICPNVAKNMDIIRRKVADGYSVIFVGYENHPETVASLAISSSVILYDVKNGLKNGLKTDNKVFITNQTTLNFVELNSTFNYLKNIYKNAEFNDEICSATRIRQENLLKISDDVDCVIVVGDEKSSNSTRLFEIAKNKKASTFMVSSESDLTYEMIANKYHIVVTSGTSVPIEVIDCVIDKIKNISK